MEIANNHPAATARVSITAAVLTLLLLIGLSAAVPALSVLVPTFSAAPVSSSAFYAAASDTTE